MKKEIVDARVKGFQQIRDEYFNLIAKIEYQVSVLIVERLDVNNNKKEFGKWFITAPISFDCKVNLLGDILKNGAYLSGAKSLIPSLQEFNKFRDVLTQLDSYLTANDEEVNSATISSRAMRRKLNKLNKIEGFILDILHSCRGTNIPVKATEDFAICLL